MGKVLLIDDDAAFLALLEKYVEERYPGLNILTCNDPIKCLAAISEDLDLLLVDLEMPGIDGSKILSYAISRGVSKSRIIILSGHDTDYLHNRFPMGSCLAVLNKFEVQQENALDMISALCSGKTRRRRLLQKSIKHQHVISTNGKSLLLLPCKIPHFVRNDTKKDFCTKLTGLKLFSPRDFSATE